MMFKFSPGDLVERNDLYYKIRSRPIESIRETFVVDFLKFSPIDNREVIVTTCRRNLYTDWVRKTENV